MYTYQDYLAIGEDEAKKHKFMLTLIGAHKASEEYDEALVAQDYYNHKNRTITEYQKLLYTVSGKAVPDNFSANYKLASNFFQRFVVQQNQYLLGNGVSFPKTSTKKRLGADFDTKLQEAARYALVDKVAFVYWGVGSDGQEGIQRVFRLTEFAPLYDEETGALMAGVRFWQLDKGKPIRATIYELDGYTELMWKSGDPEIIQPKRPYIRKYIRNTEGVDESIAWENYPGFPVVPLWGNEKKQSEIVGIRHQIDAYDLIKSGFANDLDDVSQIYWTIQNAGGMDDVDLVEFMRHMRTIKAAVVVDDGAKAESHTVEVPYAARETLLQKIRADLYDDYMALDTKEIASGAVTATQIKAAYEPLNSKADLFEYQIKDFLQRLGKIIGEDLSEATFTRSAIINTQEAISNLVTAGNWLPQEYLTKKVLELMGDGDQADRLLKQMADDEVNRWRDMNGGGGDGSRYEGDGQNPGGAGEAD